MRRALAAKLMLAVAMMVASLAASARRDARRGASRRHAAMQAWDDVGRLVAAGGFRSGEGGCGRNWAIGYGKFGSTIEAGELSTLWILLTLTIYPTIISEMQFARRFSVGGQILLFRTRPCYFVVLRSKSRYVTSGKVSMRRVLFRLGCLFTLAIASAGCTQILVWKSKERASWDFIKSRCDGIAIGKVDSSGSQLRIPLKIWDRFNSSICIYEPRAVVNGDRIEISVVKGLCSGGPVVELVAVIAKPKPGIYRLVYSDASANFPRIGEISVE